MSSSIKVNPQRERLWKSANGLCHYCGCHTELDPIYAGYPQYATIDHIIPHALGGSNDLSNKVLACLQCNGSKGTRLVRQDGKLFGAMEDSYAQMTIEQVGHARQQLRVSNAMIAHRLHEINTIRKKTANDAWLSEEYNEQLQLERGRLIDELNANLIKCRALRLRLQQREERRDGKCHT